MTKKEIDFFDFYEDEESRELEIRELTLQHGIEFPTDEELIMLLLGSGTKEVPIQKLARRVLETVMSSNREELIEKLMEIRGIGKSKALIIAAAMELGKRVGKNPAASIRSPGEIVPYIQSYAIQKQEHFLCISLKGTMEILSIRVICIGTSNMAIIRPREVFAEALKEHASAIIVCHNHPGGNPSPSRQDVQTTLRLSQAAEIIGLSVLDHIIISTGGYYSFLEHDCMELDSLCQLLEKYE